MLLNTHNFPFSYPLIMGICNVTRDSFSDRGKSYKIADALKNIKKMNKQGASMIDIGAESTRPGSDPMSYNQEIKKLEPILKKRISQVLEENELKTEIPEDLNNIVNKAVGLQKHLKSNKGDRRNVRSLELIEAKVHRLSVYYKKIGRIPKDWKYKSVIASLE